MRLRTSVQFPPPWTWKRIPRRFLMVIVAFFGFFHVSVTRVNMSIAIVAMTSKQNVSDVNGTIYETTEFEWDSHERGVVLSSFFYGYITSQIMGGILARIVGAGRLYGLSIFFVGTLTLLIPRIANQGIWALAGLRVAQGILQGVIFPAMHDFLSHWTPPLERTKLLTIAYSGNHFGTFITMATCGFLAEYFGWPFIFYIYGTTAMMWAVFWFCIFSEDPTKHPAITDEELDYIVESIGPLKRNKLSKVPWRSIWSSSPVWANFVIHIVYNFGFYTFLTQLPTFLNDVTGVQVGKAGLLSAIPYLSLSLVLVFGGQLADVLRTRFRLSTTVVRKIFSSGSYLVQMAVLLIVAQYHLSTTTLLICLTVAVAVGGFSAHSVNYLDLAPQYASIIVGVGNTLATLPGILIPSLTGLIVQNRVASEWRIVFYITSSVYAFGVFFYTFFGSGETQPWANKVTLPSEPIHGDEDL